MRFLLTGTAGFIGFHLARRLLTDGHSVAGIDGVTAYYDPALKRARLERLAGCPGFTAHEVMLEDGAAVRRIVEAERAEIVVHLAAQAGVRYSLENPRAYLDSNILGTHNLLEALRASPPRHLLFASTSSVYGGSAAEHFRETDPTDHPLTVYAATKKAGELLIHSSAHLWGLPCTAFRFFTVYGPWGRPDMALFRFVRAILAGEPIDIYGDGGAKRDFTYIDDLVEAVVRLVPTAPSKAAVAEGVSDTLSPVGPYRVVNIGGGRPEPLLAMIEAIEATLGRPAVRNHMPPQKGDLPHTSAAPDLLVALTGFRPSTPLADGVAAFVEWYRGHYGV